MAMASGSQHRRVGLGRCPQAGSAGPDRAARDTVKSPNTNQGPLESHETPLSGGIPFCLSLLGSAYLLALHDEAPGPTINYGS